MNRIKFLFLSQLLAIIVVSTVQTGCGKEETEFRTENVAQIGDRNISVPEFLLNYEFGFAHLKKNPDKKLSYLKYMINEKLLSLDGYRLGLDKSERLQDLEERLLEDLLVEELFKKEVDEKINITPREIKEAIAKSNVRWKLKYWVEPSLEASEYLYRKMQELGSGNVSQKNPETDYLTWLDFPIELLQAIENLQVGNISEPIEYNKLFYIIQVTDIRMGLLSEYDYQVALERYEQILYHRKLNEETAKYVSSFMTPKNVITKGNEFRMLADALAEWKQQKGNGQNFSESVEKAEESAPASFLLKNHLGNTLISFEDGSWSLKEYMGRLDPAALKTDPSNKNRFRNELNRQIAMSIRNHLLTNEAKRRGLDQSADVQEQLQLWRDKWVYEETRSFYTKNVRIDETIAMNYFEKNKSRYRTAKGIEPTFNDFANQSRQYAYLEETQLLLEQKIKSLKKDYLVQINQEVLDSISVIDFEKSRWANLILFKRSNGMLAVPSVDPSWGSVASYN